MKQVFIGIGIFILLIVGGWFFRYHSAEIRGIIGAKEQIESADHRIYSYQHFYDLYANVKSYETALKSQQDNLKQAETSSERQRIRSNISGIKSQLRRAIEEYNADASKVKTMGKFKSDDLPERIEYENHINY